MRPTRFKPARRQGGFTLLEMLAVIVLLGIVATIVVRQVGGNVDKGKYGAGKAQLASLSMKIESYGLDVGSPPKTRQQRRLGRAVRQTLRPQGPVRPCLRLPLPR